MGSDSYGSESRRARIPPRLVPAVKWPHEPCWHGLQGPLAHVDLRVLWSNSVGHYRLS
jgi:hypothetical protein